MRGAPPSKDSVLLGDQRGDTDTEEKPGEDGGKDWNVYIDRLGRWLR